MDRRFTEFLSTLTEEQKKIFHHLEKCISKITNASAAVNFNRNCLREKLHPRNIHMYIYMCMYTCIYIYIYINLFINY